MESQLDRGSDPLGLNRTEKGLALQIQRHVSAVGSASTFLCTSRFTKDVRAK